MPEINAKSRFVVPLFLLSGGFFLFQTISAAAAEEVQYTRTPEIRIYDPLTKLVEKSFYAFDRSFEGGASVAACDLGRDGKAEIIAGAGPGGAPHVRLFRADGSYLNGFFPYDTKLRHGVNVACGDIDGDEKSEIITVPKFGAGPYVRVFDGYGKPKGTPGFYVFDPAFHGGVNLAVGDITGDGKDEILVAAGPGSSPHVRVFTGGGKALNIEFRPFDSNADKGGVSIAVANVDGGAEDEIIATLFQAGKSWVKVYKNNVQKTILGNFLAYAESYDSGVRVTGGDFRGKGIEEIASIPNVGGGPQVRFFKGHGEESEPSFMAFEQTFRGGGHVTAGDTDGDGKDELIAAPGRRVAEGRTDWVKYIEVNLTEQRLYAYENGYLQYTALISSGLRGFDTPTGEFAVLRKVPIMTYRWSYGAGSPLNYSIPNVKYNLEFKRHFYLHNAYWHNQFGRRKSHGCVNMDMKISEWIYNWGEVGTKVWVHD